MSGPEATSPAFLQERVVYLEEANRRYLSILDMLASSSEYHGDLSRARDAAAIFRATMGQIRRILPTVAMGCLESADDGTFRLLAWEPVARGDELQAEVDAKIMDGTFAWALNRNQAIQVPLDGGRTFILHVIATRSRIRGMFAGILADEGTALDAAWTCRWWLRMTPTRSIASATRSSRERPVDRLAATPLGQSASRPRRQDPLRADAVALGSRRAGAGGRTPGICACPALPGRW